MKYTIKVIANDPNATIDERYGEGIECDGFVIIGDNDEGAAVAIHDINSMNIAMDIAGNDQLYAASIVAKALHESKKILANSRMNDKMGDLLRALSGNKED